MQRRQPASLAAAAVICETPCLACLLEYFARKHILGGTRGNIYHPFQMSQSRLLVLNRLHLYCLLKNSLPFDAAIPS